MTSVESDGLCVSDAFVATRLEVAEAASVTFSVNGSDLAVQYTTPAGVRTASGTLGG